MELRNKQMAGLTTAASPTLLARPQTGRTTAGQAGPARPARVWRRDASGAWLERIVALVLDKYVEHRDYPRKAAGSSGRLDIWA